MKGKAKLTRSGAGTSMSLTIPKDVREDSAFPFKMGEWVEIELVRGVLIIRKKEASGCR